MIPNMYKIAGELLPTVIHVAARTVATHALSIFGDHSDVMATRGTGWSMIASNSVQEAHDMAAIAQMATLESRIPFLHFFDGFRTSHEVNMIEELSDDDLRALIPIEGVIAHRERRMDPDRPVLRGTAQNPDVFFQAREACNPFYDAIPDIVQKAMDRFSDRTGRRYHLFDGGDEILEPPTSGGYTNDSAVPAVPHRDCGVAARLASPRRPPSSRGRVATGAYIGTAHACFGVTGAFEAADEVDRLFVDDMFQGYPGTHLYESVDGVGFLLLSLILLETGQEPEAHGFGF